ncbi:MAG: sulfatase-like hydrolase/transferase [Opitutaceae bacterium]|nr:sulfatase-like hydrolase/transferase [Opitutaceae bacterium]
MRLIPALLFTTLLLQTALGEAPRPNILLIVSDDQGYADAGFQGSRDIVTPHLDRLAAKGIRFTNGYVTHAFCSPSRAGLMTGRYQQRFGHERNVFHDPSDHTEGLPTTETLLPARLRATGYMTGWIGKWHLGAAPEFVPARRGFAETFGFIGGGHRFRDWKPNAAEEYFVPLERNGRPVEVTGHLTTVLGNEAVNFVNRHTDKPWFLYLAFNAPHNPQQPTDERLARFAAIKSPLRQKYAAQISLMDDVIGETLAALHASGQAERTLVIFFSDNGGTPANITGADNTPLRGAKGLPYEGGIRVPFLVSWPGHLPSGSTEHRPVSAIDVFATALAVAGAEMPKDRIYDSVNLIPFLTGENSGAPHERLFWRNGGQWAIREGDWKLVRLRGQPDELYHLSQDIGEKKDLASKQPAVAARLATALAAWDQELIDPVFLGLEEHNAAAKKAPRKTTP